MAKQTIQEVKRQLSGKHVFYFKLLEPFPKVGYMSGIDCGFFALNIAMNYRHNKFRDPAGSLNQLEALMPGSPAPGVQRQLLKQGGFVLGSGSMDDFWTANELKNVAFNQGYVKTEVLNTVDFEDIKDLVKQEYAPMVAIDVDAHGNPGTYGGANAQWVVILGIAVHKDGSRFVVATHSWGGYYLWSMEDLARSNMQLLSLPQYQSQAQAGAGQSTTSAPSPVVSLNEVRNKIVVIKPA